MEAQRLGKEKRQILARKKEKEGLSVEDKEKLTKIDQRLVQACGGKRTSRSMYQGKANKSWLSDLSCALNHIRIGLQGNIDTTWVRHKMFKLCRPRVFQCKGSFLDLGVPA
jgi:hypothetical protein